MRRNRTKGDNEANSTLPPTVAPIRATASNNGMFMLKTELSASHVSAKAFKGVLIIKAVLTRNAVVGIPTCLFSC